VLVLTRKIDESILIGDDIRIMVVGIDGGQVKLGIDAPRSIQVHRKEVYDDMQQPHVAGLLSSPEDPRWVALCRKCDYTGIHRRTQTGAQADLEAHKQSDGHRMVARG